MEIVWYIITVACFVNVWKRLIQQQQQEQQHSHLIVKNLVVV